MAQGICGQAGALDGRTMEQSQGRSETRVERAVTVGDGSGVGHNPIFVTSVCTDFAIGPSLDRRRMVRYPLQNAGCAL